jgi:hypothetical protein
MRTHSLTPLALCLALVTHAALAAPVPPAVRAEIDALLLKLQSSGCEFNRNGSWYSGAEAKTHLLRKLDYLDGKGSVQSTEQFIELGASTSSSSGKAYQVKCGTAAPVDSKAWLSAELKTVRAGARPAAGAAVGK